MDNGGSKIDELEARIFRLEQENKQISERLMTLENLKFTPIMPPGQKVKPPSEVSRVSRDFPVSDLGPEKTNDPGGLKTAFNKLSQSRTEKSSLSSESMEIRIGGTLLNRIGIVAFIFGLGFFLKYSFDNNWIGPTGRTIIGILSGLCLLAGGEFGQRKKYRIFAQGLTGGGIAALYFSIFAAFSLYHLIGQLTAFSIMILITSAAVLLSVRYDSYAIALLGIIGGFLTPFFLSTGKPNQIGLFSYIALLDCGILALAYFKKWRSINYISFIATVIILLIWVESPFSKDPVWTNQIFYTIFFFIFAFLAVFYNMVHRIQTRNEDLILITANALVFFALSFFNLNPHYSQYMGILPFSMAVIYFLLGYLGWRRNKEDKFLVLSLWGISVFFLTVTMPIQLHGRWITVAWAIESGVLLWLGFNSKSYNLRRAALIVMGIALLRLQGDASPYIYQWDLKHFRPVVNLYMLPFIACIAVAFGGALLYRKNQGSLNDGEKSFRHWLFTLAIVLSGIYASLEVFHFYADWGTRLFGTHFPAGVAQALTKAVIWHAVFVILVRQGLKHGFIPARVIGLFVFVMGLLMLFGQGSEAYLYVERAFLPILNPRSVPYLFGVLSAGFAVRLYGNAKGLQEFDSRVGVILALAANLVALGYLSLETAGFYTGWGEKMGLGGSVDSAIQMTLSVIWTLYAISLLIAGFILKSKPARLMAIGIFGVTVIKVFLFDLANLDTIYRIVSFIVLGGLLVVVSFLYQRYRNRIFTQLTNDEKEGV